MAKTAQQSTSVVLSPKTPVAGDTVKVNYNGYLSNTSDSVFVHLGYTENSNSWSDVQNIQMYKTANNVFEAEVPVKDKECLNFSFYDTYGNWDNNFGSNYTYNVKIRPNW